MPRLASKRKGQVYVWEAKDGKPKRYSAKPLQSACDRAGMDRIDWHHLRHTAATKLAKSGKVTLYDIQMLLGHTQASTTQIYADLMPQDESRRTSAVLDCLNGDGIGV